MTKAVSTTKPKPGPFSKDRSLAAVDGRSKAGRTFRATIAALVEQIGGNPTPAQALIIQSAALKATRLFLLSEKLIAGGEIGEGSEHHALGWLNSMRTDLQALGLDRRELDKPKDGPTLAEIVEKYRADGAGGEPR